MCATCTKAVGPEIIDLSIRPPFPAFFFCFFFPDFAFSFLDPFGGDLTFFANVFASPSAVKTKAIIHCFYKGKFTEDTKSTGLTHISWEGMEPAAILDIFEALVELMFPYHATVTI